MGTVKIVLLMHPNPSATLQAVTEISDTIVLIVIQQYTANPRQPVIIPKLRRHADVKYNTIGRKSQADYLAIRQFSLTWACTRIHKFEEFCAVKRVNLMLTYSVYFKIIQSSCEHGSKSKQKKSWWQVPLSETL